MTWLTRWFVRDELLAVERYEPACVVPDDPGSVTRHARPLTEADRASLREQAIGRLRRDDAAVLAREIRIAGERHKLVTIRRRA